MRPKVLLMFVLLLPCYVSGEKELFSSNKRKGDEGEASEIPFIKTVEGSVADQVVAEVLPEFMSVALGARLIQRHWLTFDTSSPRLQTLARALSPAIVRMGGTAANFLTYDPSSSGRDTTPRHQPTLLPQADDDEVGLMSATPCGDEDRSTYTNFTMFEDDWVRLNEFANTVGWQLLFDLNQFYRDNEGNWDESNALLIFRDAAEKGYGNILWQLGNEPNSNGKFNYTNTGSKMAADFAKLRDEMQRHFPELYKNASFVGPDTTRPRHVRQLVNQFREEEELCHEGRTDPVLFLEEFLESGGKDLVDVVSWHQYYFDGRTATEEDFLSLEYLDVFERQVAKIVGIRDILAPGKPIWLTETGSAYGGGAPNLSNRFASSFMFLDKLGLAAQGGISLVARQTFYHGNYAMIDNDLMPYPDYWVALLYKRLVGTKVLLFTQDDPNPDLRLYASCATNYYSPSQPGAVVLYGLNLGDKDIHVRLNGQLAKSSVLQLLLRPAFGQLTDRDITLNGRVVEFVNDILPDLNPVETSAGGFDVLPRSVGFWVMPEANLSACY